ncbi:MAG: hypothetical protein ABL891_02125 [Burkholderiales bacterium]
MNNVRAPKETTPQMPLEELARRMLAMPPKERADLAKKKPKKRAKK